MATVGTCLRVQRSHSLICCNQIWILWNPADRYCLHIIFGGSIWMWHLYFLVGFFVYMLARKWITDIYYIPPPRYVHESHVLYEKYFPIHVWANFIAWGTNHRIHNELLQPAAWVYHCLGHFLDQQGESKPCCVDSISLLQGRGFCIPTTQTWY